MHDDEGPQSLQGSLLDTRPTSSMGDATHMLMSGEDDAHSNACFSPSAGPASRCLILLPLLDFLQFLQQLQTDTRNPKGWCGTEPGFMPNNHECTGSCLAS